MKLLSILEPARPYNFDSKLFLDDKRYVRVGLATSDKRDAWFWSHIRRAPDHARGVIKKTNLVTRMRDFITWSRDNLQFGFIGMRVPISQLCFTRWEIPRKDVTHKSSPKDKDSFNGTETICHKLKTTVSKCHTYDIIWSQLLSPNIALAVCFNYVKLW